LTKNPRKDKINIQTYFMNFWPLFLLISGGVVLTVGDVAMRRWVKGDGTSFYLIGLVVYLVGLNFLAQSYRFRNIAGASTVMTIINIVLLISFSWLYFKEPPTLIQSIGLVLGIAAIIFLELGAK
jgi:multidrug transporter EmrE-like cation transporter